MNLYVYSRNDPLNLLDPMGTQACPPDMAGCYEAAGYDPAKVIDSSTITQTPDITDAMNFAAPLYETNGVNEDVLEHFSGSGTSSDPSGFRYNETDVTTDVGGVLETSFDTPPSDTDALLHTHPNDISNAAPGPGDDAAVKALGITNNIVHDGTVGHVGMVNGQFFYQVTRGTLSAPERQQTRDNLRDFQRRNQY